MGWHVFSNANGPGLVSSCYHERSDAVLAAFRLLCDIWQLNAADVPSSVCKTLNAGEPVYVDPMRTRQVFVVVCNNSGGV